jgi:hypothetical protein
MVRMGPVLKVAPQGGVGSASGSSRGGMPGASDDAEAVVPLPGRCFPMVSRRGEAGPSHCPEPVVWRGPWRTPQGRRDQVEACEGHIPVPAGDRLLVG